MPLPLESASPAASSDQPTRRIVTFVLLALALQWLVGLLGKYVLFVGRGASQELVAGSMYTPTLAILLTWLFTGRPKVQLGLQRPRHASDLVTACLFDPILYGLAYALAVALGIARPRYLELIGHLPMGFDHLRFGLTGWPSLAPVLLGLLVTGIPLNGLFAFGEELGWRGFLQRQLAFLDPVRATLLVGGIWAVWHLPPILLYGYSFPHLKLIGFVIFSVSVISESMLFAWLVFRSGSVWPAVMLHAVHNLTSQGIYPLIFRGTWQTELLLGEDGLLPTALHLAAGIYLVTSGMLRAAYEGFRDRSA